MIDSKTQEDFHMALDSIELANRMPLKAMCGWKWVGLLGIAVLFSFSISVVRAAELPEGKGKEVLENGCIQCHGLGTVTNSKLSKKEWEDMVNDMVARGAALTEEEVGTVTEYLTKNFAKEKPGGEKSSGSDKGK